MNNYRCSFVINDRPASIDIEATDPERAICVALDYLSDERFLRMELFDEHGLIYFRQVPSHRALHRGGSP